MPGTYLIGGQTFTDYDAAVAANDAVQRQVAAGGDALLRDVQPGGTMTDDAVAALAAPVDSTDAGSVADGLPPLTWLVAGGIVAVAWWISRRK